MVQNKTVRALLSLVHLCCAPHEASVLPLLSSIGSAVSHLFLGCTLTSFAVPLVGVLSETTADMISEMRKPIYKALRDPQYASVPLDIIKKVKINS